MGSAGLLGQRSSRLFYSFREDFSPRGVCFPDFFRSLSRHARRSPKVPVRRRTEQHRGKHHKHNRMDRHLLHRMEVAQPDVKPNPSHRQPARPVSASKQIYSAHDRQEPDNEDSCILAVRGAFEFSEMVCNPHRAYCYQQVAENCHRDWTLVHGIEIGNYPISALAIARAAMAAVSALKMVGPSEADIHPAWSNCCNSSGVHPPSGPIASATEVTSPFSRTTSTSCASRSVSASTIRKAAS